LSCLWSKQRSSATRSSEAVHTKQVRLCRWSHVGPWQVKVFRSEAADLVLISSEAVHTKQVGLRVGYLEFGRTWHGRPG
jgi:hypothetical protein